MYVIPAEIPAVGGSKKFHNCNLCRYMNPEIFLNVKGRRESVFTERTGKLDSVAFNLDIRPLLVFKNCLPVNIYYSVGCDDGEMLTLEPGKSGLLQVTIDLSIAIELPVDFFD